MNIVTLNSGVVNSLEYLGNGVFGVTGGAVSWTTPQGDGRPQGCAVAWVGESTPPTPCAPDATWFLSEGEQLALRVSGVQQLLWNAGGVLSGDHESFIQGLVLEASEGEAPATEKVKQLQLAGIPPDHQVELFRAASDRIEAQETKREALHRAGKHRRSTWNPGRVKTGLFNLYAAALALSLVTPAGAPSPVSCGGVSGGAEPPRLSVALPPYGLRVAQGRTVEAWAQLAQDTATKHGKAYGTFATITFRELVNDEYSDKALRRFMHATNRRIFGKNYYKRGEGLLYFVGKESYREDRSFHFHILIEENERFDPAWAKTWCFRYFGIARFYPYDPKKGALWYLGKYAGKGGDCFVHVPGPIEAGGRCTPRRHWSAGSLRTETDWHDLEKMGNGWAMPSVSVAG